VSVAKRRAKAHKTMAKRRKQGLPVEPVEVQGRTIARTFWGQAWCEHLEKFSDFANRLPRGRTYLRNGSVCHLEITGGLVEAMVMGSELYEVRVTIKKLARTRWRAVKARCAGGIATLLELLEGRLSDGVMAAVTDRDHGIFPLPREITLDCSCPDWAVMCKHVAAVLYGVGARLDQRPELLFLLRGVDHQELISTDASAVTAVVGKRGGRRRIAQGDLAGVFDIDLLESNGATGKSAPAVTRAKSRRRPSKRGAVAARRAKATHEKPAGASSQSAVRVVERATRGSTSPPRSFTGAAVKRLRTTLGMTRAQFAQLLGVSGAAIGNWEKTKGRLKLRTRSHDALVKASSLSPADARACLERM